MRALMLIVIWLSIERALRLRWATVSRRRRIACDYRITLLLGWPEAGLVPVGYSTDERTSTREKVIGLLNMWRALRWSSGGICRRLRELTIRRLLSEM